MHEQQVLTKSHNLGKGLVPHLAVFGILFGSIKRAR